ncbi:hypothetical protein PsYK624_135970 [Phanerochaete sordida]|uniref:Protein kinase domain-containing protein n=1 Tax=Phanerochaete sordida TaxID=48140 RepID=A0A9P3GPW2_9APHY|nr:hypothetical protein PsYK624_135970 [Phanerochaete sordida]
MATTAPHLDIRNFKRHGSQAPPQPWPSRMQTAPAHYNVEKKRVILVKNLQETVTLVGLDLFTNGLLPRVDPALIKATVARLKDTRKILGPDGSKPRWSSFRTEPSNRRAGEDIVFAQMESVIRDIAEAAGVTDTAILTFICRPTQTPKSSTRDNPSKPDSYGIRASADVDAQWVDIAVPGEFKKRDDPRGANDNQKKVLWSLFHILREDPTRRFVLGFTIEDTMVRFWYASRSEVFVSCDFDFMQQPSHLVECFLPLLCAEEHQLGWDPTIRRVSDSTVKSPDIVYDIDVGENTYRTQRLISNLGAEAPRGRGTRVWEVRLLDADKQPTGPPLVLKDSWGDSDRRSEFDILHDIRNSGSPSLRKTICKYFVEAIDHWDVQIAGKDDHTHVIKKDGTRPEAVWAPFTVSAEYSATTRTDAKPVQGVFKVPERGPNEGAAINYSAKIHRRIVFKQVGRTLQELSSMSQVFNCLADITTGLRALHHAGWVHRDISIGNLLVVGNTGMITDVEYAKRIDDGVSHGIRTGTPYFMAVEVEHGRYKFITEDSLPALPLQVHVDDEEESDLRSVRANMEAASLKRRRDEEQEASLSSVETIKESSPRRVGFRHNPLHDMESVLWVSYWMVLCTKLARPATCREAIWEQYMSKHAEVARKLFTEPESRSSVLETNDVLRGAFYELVPEVETICMKLDRFRRDLCAQYRQCEKNPDAIRPFDPEKKLHEAVEQVFDTISKMLKDPNSTEPNPQGVKRIGDLVIGDGVSEQRGAIEKVTTEILDDTVLELPTTRMDGVGEGPTDATNAGDNHVSDDADGSDDDERPAKRHKAARDDDPSTLNSILPPGPRTVG